MSNSSAFDELKLGNYMGTVHKSRGLFLPFLTPAPSPIVVLRGFWKTPPKKHVAFLKRMGIYRQTIYATKKTGCEYYLLYFIKEIRYNINQSVWIAEGERKGDCERGKGVARTRKRCAFKKLRISCARSHHGFSQKTSKQDHLVFVGPLPPPPSWCDVILQGTPLLPP